VSGNADNPYRSLVALRDAIAGGELSAEQATRRYLDRVAEHDGESGLNAYRELHADAALADARAVDAGDRTGPLAGVPIAVKDLFCTTVGRTSAGSRMLAGYRSPFTATCVQRLLDAGAVVLGKTNMDEFAMGSSCETCAFGPTRNPWDTARVPGGSSGGSAAAVAADLAAASLGTDTGGSIRQPAALCGIVGLKPTYGRISRWGMVAFASSLDQCGPMTRTVADAALLLQQMAGLDPHDSTTADVPVEADLHDVDAAPTGGAPLRIGVARDHLDAEGNDPAVTAAVQRALEIYRDAGAQVVDIDLPHARFGIPCYYIVAPAEASSNLARYDGVHFGHRAKDANELIDMVSRSRGEGFGDEVKRRITLGTYALSSGYHDAYYVRALRVRRLIKQDFDRAFERCDAILGPTTTGPAFGIGDKTADPLAMYLNDIYTVPANLSGLPAISLPAGLTPEDADASGLPVGVQLVGGAFDERRLLRIARLLERGLGADAHPVPPGFR
jgi:aspartyl-tRNA(Asn)/glutamyl-tRNA(Gln) amidotransferase subunit A